MLISVVKGRFKVGCFVNLLSEEYVYKLYYILLRGYMVEYIWYLVLDVIL